MILPNNYISKKLRPNICSSKCCYEILQLLLQTKNDIFTLSFKRYPFRFNLHFLWDWLYTRHSIVCLPLFFVCEWCSCFNNTVYVYSQTLPFPCLFFCFLNPSSHWFPILFTCIIHISIQFFIFFQFVFYILASSVLNSWLLVGIKYRYTHSSYNGISTVNQRITEYSIRE